MLKVLNWSTAATVAAMMIVCGFWCKLMLPAPGGVDFLPATLPDHDAPLARPPWHTRLLRVN